MSKSYAKNIKLGICTGSNTEFYRDRRKHQRRVNSNRIKNVLANNEIEEFDDKYIPYNIPKRDDWEEPTDGTVILSPKDVKELDGYNIYVTKNNKIKR